MKSIGILIDKNINWQNHTDLVTDKVSKYIGLLFKASPHLIRDV